MGASPVRNSGLPIIAEVRHVDAGRSCNRHLTMRISNIEDLTPSIYNASAQSGRPYRSEDRLGLGGGHGAAAIAKAGADISGGRP